MQHQVDTHVHGPGHTGFEEGEVERREAVRHASQQQALQSDLVRLREVANAALHHAGGRRTGGGVAAAAAVARVRQAQLHQLGPQWVVVVRAIEGEVVEVVSASGRVRLPGFVGRDRPLNDAVQHANLETQCLDRVFGLFDAFLRCHGGNDGRRPEAVGVVAKHVGGHRVVGAYAAAPQVTRQAGTLTRLAPWNAPRPSVG